MKTFGSELERIYPGTTAGHGGSVGGNYVDIRAGNTETEATKSTRKFLEVRESLRYRREEEDLAERKNVFCYPVSFLTRSRVACISGLCLRVLWNQQVVELGDGDLWWW